MATKTKLNPNYTLIWVKDVYGDGKKVVQVPEEILEAMGIYTGDTKGCVGEGIRLRIYSTDNQTLILTGHVLKGKEYKEHKLKTDDYSGFLEFYLPKHFDQGITSFEGRIKVCPLFDTKDQILYGYGDGRLEVKLSPDANKLYLELSNPEVPKDAA